MLGFIVITDAFYSSRWVLFRVPHGDVVFFSLSVPTATGLCSPSLQLQASGDVDGGFSKILPSNRCQFRLGSGGCQGAVRRQRGADATDLAAGKAIQYMAIFSPLLTDMVTIYLITLAIES